MTFITLVGWTHRLVSFIVGLRVYCGHLTYIMAGNYSGKKSDVLCDYTFHITDY